MDFTLPTTKEQMRFTVEPDYNNPAFKLFENIIEKMTKYFLV